MLPCRRLPVRCRASVVIGGLVQEGVARAPSVSHDARGPTSSPSIEGADDRPPLQAVSSLVDCRPREAQALSSRSAREDDGAGTGRGSPLARWRQVVGRRRRDDVGGQSVGRGEGGRRRCGALVDESARGLIGASSHCDGRQRGGGGDLGRRGPAVDGGVRCRLLLRDERVEHRLDSREGDGRRRRGLARATARQRRRGATPCPLAARGSI